MFKQCASVVLLTYYFLHYLWVRICIYIVRRAKKPRDGDLDQSIVVIGDDIGLGFGDYVTPESNAGISKILQRSIIEEKRLTKQRWTVYNRCHYKSTTRDWLPDQNDKPNFKLGVQRTLWRDNFAEDSRFNGCRIVVIVLGSRDNDVGIKVNETLDNLNIIVESLMAMDKDVYLCLPTARGRNLKAKRMIKNMKEDMKDMITSIGCKKGVDLDSIPRTMLCKDGIHPNTEGYAKLGKDMYKIVSSGIIAAEWKVWKNKI